MRGARACRSKMRRKKLMVLGVVYEKRKRDEVCIPHSADESDARDGESSCTRSRRVDEYEGSKGVRGVEVWDEKHAVVIDRVMGAIFGWEWGGEAWVWAND